MGYEDFVHDENCHEVSFKLNLDRMEQYDDFKYVSGQMFTQALTNNVNSNLKCDIPSAPNRAYQYTYSNPLDSLDKFVLSDDLAVLFALNKLPVSNHQTKIILPQLFDCVDAFKKEEQEKAQQLAKLRKEQKAALKKAAKAAKQGQVANNIEANTSLQGIEDEKEVSHSASLTERIHEQVLKLQEELSSKHRYQGRSLNVRLIEAPDQDFSSALMTLNILYNQLKVEDEGITDMLRDVFVYEWFDKLEDKSAFKAVSSLEELYNALQLSEIVIFPDGKSILWYEIKNQVLGESYQGFGIDVDPPYLSGYAVGIKHVFLGQLQDHPTLKFYQQLLAHKGLAEVVNSVHYCPSDNISPFDAEETSEQMIFINNGYFIFDIDINGKNIEVLVKESDSSNFDDIAKRLSKLKTSDLSSFDELCSDIINTIAQPIVDMKNQQEARRRNHDQEFANYSFKDPVLSSNLTVPKLLRNYNLDVERIILDDDDIIKFQILSKLFAFTDKADNQFLESEASLGLVHADAIVVTLQQQGESLEVTSIDLADSVQIPYGSHKNEDVESFKENSLLSILEQKDEPCDELWLQEWKDTLEDPLCLEKLNLKPQSNDAQKNMLSNRARLRKTRKKQHPITPIFNLTKAPFGAFCLEKN